MLNKSIYPKAMRVLVLSYWAAAMRGEVPEAVSVQKLRTWLAGRPMLANESNEQITDMANDMYLYMLDTIIK